MAQFTVTSTADSGSGTLREAIANANNTDTIVFDPSIAGQTITLASSLAINSGITIDGTGRNITISGNNSVTDFVVNNASSVGTNIRGLTIANGNGTGTAGTNAVNTGSGGPGGAAAGGVFVGQGTVRLENDVFRNDTATGGLGGSASPPIGGSGGSGGNAAGGVYAAAGTTVTLTNDQFLNDTGTGGNGGLSGGTPPTRVAGGEAAGAVYVTSGATVSASNLIFSGDTATGGTGPTRAQSYSNSNNDTVNNAAVTCFTTGTLIRTARGEVAVEDLLVGDRIVTASGALRPVTWIGQRHLDGKGRVLVHDQQPICVRAGAFGSSVPARNLRLSPGHPVLVAADADNEGGALVPIMCLINGTSITREAVTSVTYWHVELDAHDILLAEGLPVESYLDWGDRPFFDEASDHALHNPDFVVPGLSARCRPVAIEGALVEAERLRLDAVFAAELSGHSAWVETDGAWFAA